MTDLASHKIAVELSLQTQQAVQNALAADAPARQAVEYYKALEQVAERATMLLSAGAERSSALRDLSDALETWRSLREKEI